LEVETPNGVTLAFHDYYEPKGKIASQHYAFLVSETEFDQIFGRIHSRGQDYWADPGLLEAGQTTPTTMADEACILQGPRRALA